METSALRTQKQQITFPPCEGILRRAGDDGLAYVEDLETGQLHPYFLGDAVEVPQAFPGLLPQNGLRVSFYLVDGRALNVQLIEEAVALAVGAAPE